MDLKQELQAGDWFQEETKYSREKLPVGGLDWTSKPEAHKKYPGETERFALPPPQEPESHPLWRLMANRRSRRNFSNQPLTLLQLAQLLWATQGITRESGGEGFRVTPSAGALYPIETYLVVNRVEGLGPGVYHYNVRGFSLERIEAGDFALRTTRAAIHQEVVARGGVVFVWTAVIARSKWKYRQRCYRYLYLDAGHIGAHLYLAAEALGLGCCTIGAFFDEEVNQIVKVDGKNETVLYLGVVGSARSGA